MLWIGQLERDLGDPDVFNYVQKTFEKSCLPRAAESQTLTVTHAIDSLMTLGLRTQTTMTTKPIKNSEKLVLREKTPRVVKMINNSLINAFALRQRVITEEEIKHELTKIWSRTKQYLKNVPI